VYWRCCKSTWREDLAVDIFGADVDQFDLSLGFNGHQSIWEPTTKTDDLEAAHADYYDSVQAYTQRNLTYESDAINAFKGVMC
jgi:hypothetical protein